MNIKKASDENRTTSTTNVFSSLFDFRLTEHMTPKENFLTEAMIYTLRKCEVAARSWVSLITQGKVCARTVQLETRASHRDSGNSSPIYPDVTVRGRDQYKYTYRVIVEHKCNSPYNKSQLQSYSRLRKTGETLHLTFVCANSRDHGRALKFTPRGRGVSLTVLKWEDIYKTFNELKVKSDVLDEFLAFLSDQGLSPGKSISEHNLTAGQAAERNSPLRKKMRRFCEKLANEYEWKYIPSVYRGYPYKQDRYGRCATIFAKDDGWAPAIAVGFYYAISDHKVSFADPKKEIDLHLRIQANLKTNPFPDQVMWLLKKRAEALRRLGATVRLKGDLDNGNQHTLLMVQKSLRDIIRDSESEEKQIDNIYKELSRWSKALFLNNVELIDAFQKIRPY